jgi:hypothetical protein
LLARLKAIGPQIGAVLYHEGLYRSFANRRDVAAYAGLVPTSAIAPTIENTMWPAAIGVDPAHDRLNHTAAAVRTSPHTRNAASRAALAGFVSASSLLGSE